MSKIILKIIEVDGSLNPDYRDDNAETLFSHLAGDGEGWAASDFSTFEML